VIAYVYELVLEVIEHFGSGSLRFAAPVDQHSEEQVEHLYLHVDDPPLPPGFVDPKQDQLVGCIGRGLSLDGLIEQATQGFQARYGNAFSGNGH